MIPVARHARPRSSRLVLLAALALSVAVPRLARAASLMQVTSFGNNPTNLQMHLYVPDLVAAQPGVLFVLHGCQGTGPYFFSSTEFRSLADRYGFIVIYPSTSPSGSCWDVSSNAALTHNGGSDPAGLLSMLSYVKARYPVDANRVFVTGGSSGAMMTNVLLGSYPDVFKAGAAFMGVPFHCFYTGTVRGWNGQCAGGTLIQTPQQWGDLVRAAYPGYTGPRPRVQVFHGTADDILRYPNFGEEIKQWTNVLGVSQTPSMTDTVGSCTRTRYGGTGVQVPVEGVSCQGAGHVLPLTGQAALAVAFLGLDQTTGTPYALTVAKSGTGSGTVISSPNGMNCGSTCSATYASGTTVTLTATSASGSTFAGWSGACTGTSATCTVSMTTARAVTATFDANVIGGPISINAGGAASGTFVADTNFSGGSTYSVTTAIDTTQLTGTIPAQSVLQSERYGEFTYTIPGLTAGSPFAVTLYFAEVYWTAAGQRTFNVTINGSTVLTAFDIFAAAGGAGKAISRSFGATASASGQVVIQFTKGGGPDNPKLCGLAVAPATGDSYALAVTKAGTGSGTVTGASINCGATCTATYPSGTTVTLTAAAASGSTFAGWSGACTGTGLTCSVSVTAARAVTATFDTSGGTTYTLSVTKAGTGTGTVASSSGGIGCGSTCSATVASGTSVTLTATPDSGSTFAGWSGACTGTGTCIVTATTNLTVTATFNTSGGGTCKAVSGGQSGNFNTTGAICFTVTGTINGWGCSNADGRTVTVNGTAVTCGQTPLPGSAPYTFSFTAGTYPWASFYWW